MPAVNGAKVVENYVDNGNMDGFFFGPDVVPPGDVFLLGDNRDTSSDSRAFGPVPVDDGDRRLTVEQRLKLFAVVCDAEQIIHSFIDRSHKNSVIYKSGSIESTAINKNLVDVLEGTRPAFDNRESKYQSAVPIPLPVAPPIAAAE